MSLPIALGCIIAALVVGCILGGLYRKKVSEREIGSAEEKAKQIINDAYKSAESKRRETLLEAKEEIHKSRTEYEREVKERRAELQKQERRLQQKEETLDRKTDTLDKKTDALNQKIAAIDTKQNEINQLKKTQMELLEKISGYTVEEAKAFLINSLKDDVVHEQALMVKEVEAQYKDEADTRAREIIATAIQRCAADHASEVTVSVVPLPNDEMKGRIIGREGRNIRAIETLTGCDLIIDDTPRPSRSRASTPCGAKSRASRSKSSFRTAAFTPPASRKWSPRPRRRSTPPSRPRASAPFSRQTSTACIPSSSSCSAA